MKPITDSGQARICLVCYYYSDDQIQRNGMDGACSTYGERIFVYRVLVGKHE